MTTKLYLTKTEAKVLRAAAESTVGRVEVTRVDGCDGPRVRAIWALTASGLLDGISSYTEWGMRGGRTVIYKTIVATITDKGREVVQ